MKRFLAVIVQIIILGLNEGYGQTGINVETAETVYCLEVEFAYNEIIPKQTVMLLDLYVAGVTKRYESINASSSFLIYLTPDQVTQIARFEFWGVGNTNVYGDEDIRGYISMSFS